MARRRTKADLSPQTLLSAYASGAFPMASPRTGTVRFYSCDPRCVIPLDDRFHVPKSLGRVIRSGRFEVRFDTSFADVIRRCGTDREAGNQTWINAEIIAAYEHLHELGFSHSVEAWRDEVLVGGLYGVALGAAFFGESMFSDPANGGRDASKVCLVHLVDRLRTRGFQLLDSQYANDHILRFGAVQIDTSEYESLLATAVAGPQRW